MKKILLIVFSIAFASQLFAQYEHRGSGRMNKEHRGSTSEYKRIYSDSSRMAFCVALTAGLQMPAGNLANRFGFSKSVGMQLYYKSKSNFCVGISGDYFFGNKVKEDNLFANISTSDGKIVTEDGAYAEIRLYERGYFVGPTIGYINNKKWAVSKNSGMSFWLTAGYMEHKIKILGDNVLQLQDEYKKGYDRLTAGMFIQEGIFYNYMSLNHLVNFKIGVEALQGFNHGLRAINFDTGESGKGKRFDCLIGLKGAWFLPVNMHSKKEEFTF